MSQLIRFDSLSHLCQGRLNIAVNLRFQDELDDLVAAECVYCGDIMIRSVSCYRSCRYYIYSAMPNNCRYKFK